MDELSFFSSSPEILIKVALFAAVQLLVYLILSKSSAVFSPTGDKSGGSRPLPLPRSLSVLHMISEVSNISASGELSSSPSSSSSSCAAEISAALFAYDFTQGLSI
ncbi:hypothetical protein KSP40_PGU002952 [Platanthera guangdongensis]|uniref:ATP synthase F0 subunit 8 n=1 Tax=Platanthera guangdongensis TaxID=2320717 RepID=A0ABR2M347_9ASPA